MRLCILVTAVESATFTLCKIKIKSSSKSKVRVVYECGSHGVTIQLGNLKVLSLLDGIRRLVKTAFDIK